MKRIGQITVWFTVLITASMVLLPAIVQAGPSEPEGIKGYVKTEAGAPISNAKVTDTTDNTVHYTNSQGYYEYFVATPEWKQHTIKCEKDGYWTQTKTISISRATGWGTCNFNMVLKTFRGYILDSHGICLWGATVSCSGISTPVTTSNNGHYSFQCIAGVRHYTLTVSCNLHVTKTVNVDTYYNSRVDVTLQRISGYPMTPNLPSGVVAVEHEEIVYNSGSGYVHASDASVNLATGVCHGYVDAKSYAGLFSAALHKAWVEVGFANYDFVATQDKLHVKYAWGLLAQYACYLWYDWGDHAYFMGPNMLIMWNLIDHSAGDAVIAQSEPINVLPLSYDWGKTPVMHPAGLISPWVFDASGEITVTQGHTLELNCWIDIYATASAETGLGGSLTDGAVLDLKNSGGFMQLLDMGIYWS